MRLLLSFLHTTDYAYSMGWCCRDGGCFLLTSVGVLRKELRALTAHSPKHREVGTHTALLSTMLP